MVVNHLASRENVFAEKLKSWELRIALAVRHVAKVPPITKVWVCNNLESYLRLMNWKVWSLRYHVSVEFILATLYRVWRCGPKSHPNGSVSLGLSIPAATGKRAREIVQDEIIRAYPARENEQLAKEEARRRWMNLKPVGGSNYVKAVLNQRKRMEAKAASMHRRAWRENPWK
jgi:hypothetical protein